MPEQERQVIATTDQLFDLALRVIVSLGEQEKAQARAILLAGGAIRKEDVN